MGKALYRKYRSQSLDEVVGQDHITSVLRSAIDKGRISHAYLLTGPRGVGKTSVARILAHAVNDLPYSDGTHLDIIEIDAASNRRIDDIRDLREKVHITPVSSKYKVYIIDEVHMLTGESFNALLKTLEEPPEHVIFILATTEVHKLPATILSRTQRFHFRPVSEEAVVAHLKQMAEKESISIDDDALSVIARHGGGSFRDSISLLDQLAGTSDHITRVVVESIMGLVPAEQLEELTDAIVHHKTKQLIEQLGNVLDGDSTAIVLADQLIEMLAKAAVKQPDIYQLIDRLLEVPRAHQPRMKLTAVLVTYVHAHQSRTVALEVTMPAAPVVSAPLPVIAKTKPAPVKSAPESAKKPAETAEAVTSPQPNPAAPGAFDWEAVMTIMRKHHVAIASVLGRATTSYADGVLTLHFNYALHRRRMEQPAAKQLLLRVIQDVCGVEITVNIESGLPKTPEIASVTAIMGGGEPVNASI